MNVILYTFTCNNWKYNKELVGLNVKNTILGIGSAIGTIF